MKELECRLDFNNQVKKKIYKKYLGFLATKRIAYGLGKSGKKGSDEFMNKEDRLEANYEQELKK